MKGTAISKRRAKTQTKTGYKNRDSHGQAILEKISKLFSHYHKFQLEWLVNLVSKELAHIAKTMNAFQQCNLFPVVDFIFQWLLAEQLTTSLI